MAREKAVDVVLVKARLRAIRKLSSPVPTRTADDRLKRIVGIASGEISPEMGRITTSPDLLERLAAGQASRSPRIADKNRDKASRELRRQQEADKAAEAKRRKGGRGSRDRQEKGGADRSEGQED